ncbi:class I SAM-dependent methyltransferase [Synechococcus sp. OH30]|uniref:class I SAM-dependent methyltransferase n=1 Tax=Synechococcus sp. OH30 TaxID=139352 RepID=UPI0039C407F2
MSLSLPQPLGLSLLHLQTNQPLRDLIASRIRAQGPVTFAQFMEWALYEPGLGYYERDYPIGPDYLTAPQLAPDFAHLLAEQICQFWQVLGSPSPFAVIEMGAGSGCLAEDWLAYVRSAYPALWQALEYGILERSASLRRLQQERLAGFGEKVRWLTWEEIPEEAVTGCFFSNELVDAFPVHRVQVQGGSLREIYVDWAEGRFQEVLGDPSTPALEAYFARLGIAITTYPSGYQTEVNLKALEWLQLLARKLRRGYVLTIDYGYPAQRYYSPQRSQGTLLAYRRHGTSADPYGWVGCQDLTAHVDFTTLEQVGESLGLKRLGFTQQSCFLVNLGLAERLAALSQEGAEEVGQVLRRRFALQALLDPLGLGSFGVLLQAKGLSEAESAQLLRGFAEPS